MASSARTQPIPASERPEDAGDGDRALPGLRETSPAAPTPSGPTPPETPPASPPPTPPAGRRMPRALVAALAVGVLVICGALAVDIVFKGLSELNPFKHGLVQERTIDRSGPVVLQRVTDLGQFRAASGYYQLVVDVEKDVHPVPSFLAGRRELFIAAGSVDVDVNMRNLSGSAVQVSSDRTSATITVPTPQVMPASIDVAHSYMYSESRGLFNRLKDVFTSDAGQQQQLYQLADQKLEAAARANNDLVTRGENDTRAMLTGLLRALGFTNVTVQFR